MHANESVKANALNSSSFKGLCSATVSFKHSTRKISKFF